MRPPRARSDWDATFGLGVSDIGLLQDDERPAPGGMREVRAPGPVRRVPGLRPLRPAFGLQANGHGARFVYGGLLYEVDLGRGVRIAPSVVGGHHVPLDGRHLGHPLEVRSGVELSYGLGDGGRLGLMISHMSNGDLSLVNPGQENVFVTWTVPLGGASARAR